MINVLQLIVHMPLFSLNFPSNVKFFFSLMIDITNFSFLNTDQVDSKLFNFTKTQPFNQNFDDMDIFWTFDAFFRLAFFPLTVFFSIDTLQYIKRYLKFGDAVLVRTIYYLHTFVSVGTEKVGRKISKVEI